MVGDSVESKFKMKKPAVICGVWVRHQWHLPGHLILLVQQHQYVVGVDEKSPTGQTKEQQNQQTPLQDDTNALQVLTAKCLMVQIQEMLMDQIRLKDNNNQTISSPYLGNEGVTSHNESEARRSCGEIYGLGGNQTTKTRDQNSSHGLVTENRLVNTFDIVFYQF